MASHQHSAKDVDDLHQKGKETGTVLSDSKHDGLDVVLEEDAREAVLVNFLALLCHSVLVGEYRGVSDTVFGGDDGEIVLEFVEIRFGTVYCPVEGVD